MSKFVIQGGSPLYGEVDIPAAKNAILPIMASCVAIEGAVKLVHCPDLADIRAMHRLLVSLGARVRQDKDEIHIDCTAMSGYACQGEECGCMRSSLFLLGPLLARMGEAHLGLPGGCVIGARPIDIHLAGLRAFGVKVQEGEDGVHCIAADRHAARFRLTYPSVGATINLIVFALSCLGTSRLENVAIEPEIHDLICFLQQCGAKISCHGRVVEIVGGGTLHGTTYRPIADRVVAATLLCAGAMCGGELYLTSIDPLLLAAFLHKITKSPCQIGVYCDTIHVLANARHAAFSCATAPYPGYPTDMQALALAYDATAIGVGVVRETVFESRFALVGQLARFGADIRTVGSCALVRGAVLHPADVVAVDLRAGAALVLAALSCRGTSTVSNVELVDRGYQSLETLLSGIGAHIVRV